MEVERARLTKRVADKLEAEGKIEEAREMIMELQVETYGSMLINEKVFLVKMKQNNQTLGQIFAPSDATLHYQAGFYQGNHNFAQNKRQIL